MLTSGTLPSASRPDTTGAASPQPTRPARTATPLRPAPPQTAPSAGSSRLSRQVVLVRRHVVVRVRPDAAAAQGYEPVLDVVVPFVFGQRLWRVGWRVLDVDGRVLY